jgi:putative transferase (TIGR04331 family)
MKQLVTSSIDKLVLDQFIYLGDWCSLEFTENKVNNIFENRVFLSKTFKEFDFIYELMLKQLCEKLNSIHIAKKSIAYWRVIIGPWLSYFIFQVLEKYVLIESLNQKLLCANTVKYNYNLINNDLESFFKNINNPYYESLIAGEIIEFSNIQNFKNSKSCNSFTNSTKKSILRTITSNIISFLFFWYDPKILIKDTYLGLKSEAFIFFKLLKIPKLELLNTPLPEFEVSNRHRTSNLGFYSDKKLNLLSNLIMKHIPKSFLEGFLDLQFLYPKSWSKKPNVIFTSNAFWQNTIFAHYCAEKKLNGTKLVFGQHGGGYGISSYFFDEKHILDISDIYINWGWKKSDKSKPLGFFLKNSINHKPTEKLLLILINNSRNSISSELFFDYENYLIKQKALLNKLEDRVCKSVIIRSKEYESVNSQKINILFSNYKFTDPITDFNSDLRTSKLVIATYNSTVFLQCLYLNIPVLMFIHLNEYEVRDSESNLFLNLIENKIVFFNSDELSKHVNSIWDNVLEWWNDDDLQLVLSQYKSKMAFENKNLLKDISDLIKNLK